MIGVWNLSHNLTEYFFQLLVEKFLEKVKLRESYEHLKLFLSTRAHLSADGLIQDLIKS